MGMDLVASPTASTAATQVACLKLGKEGMQLCLLLVLQIPQQHLCFGDMVKGLSIGGSETIAIP